MNDEGTRKKILKDVFKKGDLWFRSGDLMSVDDDAYFYFVDRIGDTFRWKGHNVSTQEVSAAFAKIPGVVECIVYGVEVPHVSTGLAGMAAIVVDHDRFNIQLVHQILERDAGLPPYAIPIWIRIVPE